MAEYKGSNMDGQRQTMLEKQREQMMRDFERQREKIQKVRFLHQAIDKRNALLAHTHALMLFKLLINNRMPK
jgi:hypothetical protein